MVSIRVARREDESALRPIDRETWTAEVSPAPTAGSSEPFFGDDACLDDVLVAELGGDVLGYVRLDDDLLLACHLDGG
jgi:hypothetical protein